MRPTWEELRAVAAAPKPRAWERDHPARLYGLDRHGWLLTEETPTHLRWELHDDGWDGTATYSGTPRKLSFVFIYVDGFVTKWTQRHAYSQEGPLELAFARAKREKRRSCAG